MSKIVIDAKGKSAGRLATEIVRILIGKDQASFAPNKLPAISITVTNASLLRIPPRRARTKVYRRHSGAPGGFREESLEKVFAEKPEEVIRRAVYGMLPRNRLRAQALLRLHVFRGADDRHRA